MVQANCRTRFTAADFDFIVRSLARRKTDAVSLAELLADPEARDQVLDHAALLDTILTSGEPLTISPQLYFYILSRHVLRAAGIEDRALCDYIASLLEWFSRADRLNGPAAAHGRVYLSDLLLTLRAATPAQAFLLRAHVGNYALFLTGMFPESVARRSQRGAPDCSFYEHLGSASYRALAGDQTARRWGLDEIFHELAAEFHRVRLALNSLADRLLNLDDSARAPLFG